MVVKVAVWLSKMVTCQPVPCAPDDETPINDRAIRLRAKMKRLRMSFTFPGNGYGTKTPK